MGREPPAGTAQCEKEAPRVAMIDERPSCGAGRYRLRCTRCGSQPGVVVQAGEAILCADCLESLAKCVRLQLRA